MSAPFITAKNIVAVKLESAFGSEASITSTDFNIRCRDLTISPEIEQYVLEYASGAHSVAGAVMGKAMATVGFKVDMCIGSTADTAAKMGKLWQACGAKETTNASTSVVWSPDATKDTKTASIAFQYTPTSGNSVQVKMKGAMGNCKVVMDDLGQPLVSEFEFKGCFVGISDVAALVLTSPDTSRPPATVGATITVATIAQRIGRFELDFGNDIQGKFNPADATGYLGFYIAKRAPRIRVNPQLALLADDPVYTRWAAGTQGAFSFATAADAGLKWTIAAPKAQLLTNGLGDRNGEAINEQEYLLATNGTTLNSEWSITQSA